jgi:Na+-driven multidrug efflux pump
MGLAVGGASAATLWAGEARITAIFTSDPQAVAALRGPLWALLCVAQPINAAVFVYDGLMYATQVGSRLGSSA